MEEIEALKQAEEVGEVTSSSSREKKKKKKGKKEKKKDKDKDEKKKDKEKKEKEKKKKMGGKSAAKKDLDDLYSRTGLDPEPKDRKKFLKKLKKRLKKAKQGSSGSSGSGSSSSTLGEEDTVMEERSKVARIADCAPGVLAASAIKNMKTFCLQTSGAACSQDEDSLPPIASQYARSFIAPRTSGGLLREVTTVAHCLDLLVQARPAEAADCLAQRLKSLELIASGQPWSTAQKIETIAGIEAMVASRGEVQIAQKEAALDSKAKMIPGGMGDPNKGKGKGKDKNKGKDKTKGGGKQKDDAKKSS